MKWAFFFLLMIMLSIQVSAQDKFGAKVEWSAKPVNKSTPDENYLITSDNTGNIYQICGDKFKVKKFDVDLNLTDEFDLFQNPKNKILIDHGYVYNDAPHILYYEATKIGPDNEIQKNNLMIRPLNNPDGAKKILELDQSKESWIPSMVAYSPDSSRRLILNIKYSTKWIGESIVYFLSGANYIMLDDELNEIKRGNIPVNVKGETINTQDEDKEIRAAIDDIGNIYILKTIFRDNPPNHKRTYYTHFEVQKIPLAGESITYKLSEEHLRIDDVTFVFDGSNDLLRVVSTSNEKSPLEREFGYFVIDTESNTVITDKSFTLNHQQLTGSSDPKKWGIKGLKKDNPNFLLYDVIQNSEGNIVIIGQLVDNIHSIYGMHFMDLLSILIDEQGNLKTCSRIPNLQSGKNPGPPIPIHHLGMGSYKAKDRLDIFFNGNSNLSSTNPFELDYKSSSFLYHATLDLKNLKFEYDQLEAHPKDSPIFVTTVTSAYSKDTSNQHIVLRFNKEVSQIGKIKLKN